MKKKLVNSLICTVIILLVLGVVAFYIYDVVYNKTPFADNLFRTVSIVFLLLATLIRVFYGSRRKSLDIYEKAYEKELGQAFKNKAFLRKKLLCAARLYDESNYNKAFKYLFQLYEQAESQRDAVPVLLFIALCYTDAGLNEKAIEAYYKLLELDYRNEQAHSNLGLLYANEGNYEMALSHYGKSIECEPNNYYAYINRASCYFRQADYSKAEIDAKKALEIKNNGHEAASLLTIIYALLGDEENKKKYFHISVASGRKPDDIKEAIEYYLKAQDEEKSDSTSEDK